MGRHGENIRKRNDGRWEGRYKVFDQGRNRNVYRSVYGHAYEEVREKLSRARLGLTCQAKGEKGVEKPDTQQKNGDNPCAVVFSQAAREWLEEIAGRRKYSTYMKYNTVYKIHLDGIVGSCPLSAATAQEFQAKIFDHLSEGVASESLQKSICCVTNQILGYANKKYAAGVPLLRGLALESKKKIIRTLSIAEQSRLLCCIYNELDKFKLGILLCLYTGLRLGELCALQWKDFDFDNMALTVNRTVQRVAVQGYMTKTILLETDPKSESSKRAIPLAEKIVELLIRFKGSQPYVFGGEKPLDPRTMQYQFKRILKAAKVEDRNFHLLRHTFATNCVENKMDVKALSEILGHADVKITLNRYVHPTMDSKRKQIGMLPDFYREICGLVCGQAA